MMAKSSRVSGEMRWLGLVWICGFTIPSCPPTMGASSISGQTSWKSTPIDMRANSQLVIRAGRYSGWDYLWFKFHSKKIGSQFPDR
jgi:hypothetical protein